MNEFDLKKCRELVHSEKYNEALPHLESLLNSSTPSDKQTLSRIHYLTAVCLHKLQLDYKIALEHYNKALENGFDESWVRYNRGRLYIKLGDLDIAISDLRRAVELGHKDAKIELDDLSSYMESDSTSFFKLNSPVFVLSVPKSGTMLLQNILVSIFGEEQVIPSKLFNIGLIDEKYISALPELKNKIYIGHLHYSDLLAKKLHNIPKILLLRDPRDYIISYAHFLDKIKKDHFGSEEYLWDSLETIDNKISAVILGMTCKQVNHRLASAYYTYLNYCLKWIDPFSIIIRYEDIVGSKFGGDDSVVVKTFSHIMSRIGVKIDE
ncbi:MAG TPA: sulfotransferase domain-containing protein, partial [Candidatus Nitrosotalea sp.]|nr:sulfotransferase domain-containing protein [Candidatus Nitrosotalea sp.]